MEIKCLVKRMLPYLRSEPIRAFMMIQTWIGGDKLDFEFAQRGFIAKFEDPVITNAFVM